MTFLFDFAVEIRNSLGVWPDACFQLPLPTPSGDDIVHLDAEQTDGQSGLEATAGRSWISCSSVLAARPSRTSPRSSILWQLAAAETAARGSSPVWARVGVEAEAPSQISSRSDAGWILTRSSAPSRRLRTCTCSTGRSKIQILSGALCTMLEGTCCSDSLRVAQGNDEPCASAPSASVC